MEAHHLGLAQNYKTDQDFSAVKRVAFYFGPENKKIFATFHYVEGAKVCDCAILLCPSLGIEYLHPYRPLRYVADYHALAGIPALRFDYHSTGDSSGLNDEPDRLADWINSIKLARQCLRDISGCKKIILFGFRLGATLATIVADESGIDGLVLWSPVENGRKYLREIRVLQMAADKQPDSADLLEAGGAVFSEQTMHDIGKIALAEYSPKVKSILIIPRDDLPQNDKLKQAWMQRELNVEQVSYPGYTEMVIEAHFVQIPHKTIKKIVEWSRRISGDATEARDFMLSGLKSDMIFLQQNKNAYGEVTDSAVIRESIVRYGPGNSRIGIISAPVSPQNEISPIVILANSGADHRVGPNRLYVLSARALAVKGYQCIRIDMDGLGDSVKQDPETENIVYMDNSSDEILMAMSALGGDYKKHKYILMGLCAGAYYSFRASLDLSDIDIVECYMINPLTFHWEEGMTIDDSPAVTYVNWHSYKKSVLKPERWLKLLSGRVSIRNLVVTIINRFALYISKRLDVYRAETGENSELNEGKDLDKNLRELARKDIMISFLFSRDDAGFDVLMSMAGKTVFELNDISKLNIRFIEDADHTFSRYIPRCQAINAIVDHFICRGERYLTPS